MIAPGDVDERSITEVKADDIKGYTQCHFFAGIGGWSLALRLAMWPDDRPVWTGSCPCQPFSTAGKNKGQSDERHLWPVWETLIAECHPAVVFGEQVASAITKGWLDDAAYDLEKQDYAVGAAVLPACSVCTPHRRDRLWFVAHANGGGLRRSRICKEQPRGAEAISAGKAMDDSICNGRTARRGDNGEHDGVEPSSADQNVSYTNIARSQGRDREIMRECTDQLTARTSSAFLADADSGNGQRRSGIMQVGGKWEQEEVEGNGDSQRTQWSFEPDVGRVAHGVSARVGKLRGLGNAIVPQVAAQFIGAVM